MRGGHTWPGAEHRRGGLVQQLDTDFPSWLSCPFPRGGKATFRALNTRGFASFLPCTLWCIYTDAESPVLISLVLSVKAGTRWSCDVPSKNLAVIETPLPIPREAHNLLIHPAPTAAVVSHSIGGGMKPEHCLLPQGARN